MEGGQETRFTEVGKMNRKCVENLRQGKKKRWVKRKIRRQGRPKGERIRAYIIILLSVLFKLKTVGSSPRGGRLQVREIRNR